MATVLEAVWGQRRGWVSVPIRRAEDGKWIERWFEWPNDRKRLYAWIKQASPQADVYWSPLVYPEASRTYAKECSSAWAWADIDEGDPDDGPEPAVLWETSPGRTQALYRLTKRVKASLLERVNRGIASAVGADASGWDAGQVLRVPGTRNHKYEGSPKGRILRVTKARHDPAALAADAPEPPPQPDVDGALSFEQTLAEWGEALPIGVREEIVNGEAVVGERSDKLTRLINQLIRSNFPDTVIYSLIQGSAYNKFRGRSDEKKMLVHEIGRAHEKAPSLWVGDPEPPEEPEPQGKDLIIKPWSKNDWLYDYIQASTEAVPWASPWYHLAGGLACLASAIDRARELLLFSAIPASTYIMVIGPSRSGKSETQKFALRVLTSTEKVQRHVPIFTEWSPQGLARALQDSPSRHIMSYHDEAGKLFAMAKADYMSGAREFLRELYDTEFHQKVLVKQIVKLEKPCLTWYGAITPDQFTRHFTTEDLYDGTLPRFWLFYDPQAEERDFEPIMPSFGAVELLAARLDAIRERVYNPALVRVFGQSVSAQHVSAYLASGAYDSLNKRLHERKDALMDRPEMISILQNYGTDVLKLALLRALAANLDTAEGWGSVEITPAQVEEAFDILNAAQDNSLQLVQELGQSKDERLIDLITKFLSQQPHGRASRTKVMQRYGRSIGRNMDVLEAQMVDRGLIVVEFRSAGNGRQKVKYYRLRKTK